MGSLQRVGAKDKGIFNKAVAIVGNFLAPKMEAEKAKAEKLDAMTPEERKAYNKWLWHTPKDKNSGGNRISQAKRRRYARQLNS